MAVNGAGTATRASIAGRDVAGKTGTAQVISIQGRERARGSGKDLRDHGWFVFMVPRDNPELAGVIFAEHAEHGYLAAPIAKHIIETYYARRKAGRCRSCHRRRCARWRHHGCGRRRGRSRRAAPGGMRQSPASSPGARPVAGPAPSQRR